jgi:hypothetical protein
VDEPTVVRVTDDQPPLDVNVVDEHSPSTEKQRAEQDDETARISFGQRRINLLWEVTQGLVAVLLVGTVCWGVLNELELPAQFWVLAAIVVNAYYQRTNHTKVGGVSADSTGR